MQNAQTAVGTSCLGVPVSEGVSGRVEHLNGGLQSRWPSPVRVFIIQSDEGQIEHNGRRRMNSLSAWLLELEHWFSLPLVPFVSGHQTWTGITSEALWLSGLRTLPLALQGLSLADRTSRDFSSPEQRESIPYNKSTHLYTSISPYPLWFSGGRCGDWDDANMEYGMRPGT